MEIIEIIELGSGRRRIVLEDGSDFVLYKGEIQRLKLEAGVYLTDQQLQEIRDEILVKRAKLRAMHLLEKRDYTQADLCRKLRENGYAEDVIREAITYVKSYHYVDDARYASVYIRARQNSKSRNQMRMELLQKGVDDELIRQALEDECGDSELELIERLLEKKHYDPDMADQKEKQKVYQFLARKGFSGSDIRRAMRL